MVTEVKRRRYRRTYRYRKKTENELIQETHDLLDSDPETMLRKVGQRNVVIFAETNLRNESGRRLDYESHFFQKQYLEDFSPELCVIKSSQVGITTSSNVKALYLAHLDDAKVWEEKFGVKGRNGLTMIYTMPTERAINDFSSTRFRSMVGSSPLLLEMMGLKGRKKVDAVTRRVIGNSLILFRGTTKDSQAISDPADLIINDEYDFSDPSIIETLNSRITHSDLQWWWKFSTPTIPNWGIDAEYKKSNQFRFQVKCRACNKWQEVKWPQSSMKKTIRGKRIYYWGCRKCGKELDRSNGEWVARHPNRDYHGYYIPPMITPWVQPKNIKDLQKRYKTEKKFRNFALGEAFSTGADVLSRELMLKHLEYGRGFNPIIDKNMYMGVDQGDVFHFVIARGEGNRREVIHVGTRKSFDEIAQLMYEYNIRFCVLDALPNKLPAMQMAKDFYGRVFLAFYAEFDSEQDVQANKKFKYALNLDRTNTLDMSAQSWREGESAIVLDSIKYGSIPPFIDDPSNSESFIQQMGNMTRDEKENEKTGKSRAVWIKTGPDHFRHADSYCHIAWLQSRGGDISLLMTQENLILTSQVGDYFEIGGQRSDLRTLY